MKVEIGKYKHYIGPFQIADLLQHVGVSEDRCFDIGEKMPEWVNKVCYWVDGKRKRKQKIHIDYWDTWNMNDTLALIILPMLKQLKETKHGSPMVNLEDVPEHLRAGGTSQNEDMQLHLDFGEEHKEQFEKDAWQSIHDRWDWVLDEIIWSFEQIHPDNDWEKQFHSGVMDVLWKPVPGTDCSEMIRGPNDTHVFDHEGYTKHAERIQNGLRLFGVYYMNLWD
jgi:hypothetical protein